MSGKIVSSFLWMANSKMGYLTNSTAFFVALLATSVIAAAQTITATPTAPVVVAAPQFPVVDSVKELRDTALIDALRGGGFVLYMRHAQTGIVTAKCDQSNLTPDGEKVAREVGVSLRELKIPIGIVRASQLCRTGDTARLLDLGAVEIIEDLNPVPPRADVDIGAVRAKRVSEVPRQMTNTVLVSHIHRSPKREEWFELDLGEIIVFRPTENGRAEAVARIKVTDWPVLLKLAAARAKAR
jgi:phosphohistidine phosphatase SixA